MTLTTESALFSTASLSGVKSNSPSTPAKRIITVEEVSWHDSFTDCWLVIYDRVYDVTEFLDEHPGGSDILLECAGRDATVAFRSTGHSGYAVKALEKFFIGELPLAERIFRKPGGFKLSDMPI